MMEHDLPQHRQGEVMAETRRIRVTEVHNFGGFFGGDTVTLSAVPWPAGDEETLTIDEKALENITTRHLIAPEMLLELECSGERVDLARLVAAREREQVDAALGAAPPPTPLDGPRIRAYSCPSCNLWIVGQPCIRDGVQRCALCDQALG